MEWINGMQRALAYIEEHLTEEIDYEEVAKLFFQSRNGTDRLQKTFYRNSGKEK